MKDKNENETKVTNADVNPEDFELDDMPFEESEPLPWPQNMCEMIFGKDSEYKNNERIEEAITKLLETLTPREEMVMRLRYKEGKTIEEVAQDLGITRENVLQIEAMALRKLRHPKHRTLLKQLGILN